MLTTNYIPECFADDLVEKVINGDQILMLEFLEQYITLNYFDTLHEAIVDGLYASTDNTGNNSNIERAYMEGIKNPTKTVNPSDLFFKVEDGVISSSKSVFDLYPVDEMKTELFKLFIDGTFGYDILKKYCNKYNIYDMIDNSKKIGSIYLIDRKLGIESKHFIEELLNNSNINSVYTEAILKDFNIMFLVEKD